MATVRITKDLIDRLKNRGMGLFDARHTAALEAFPNKDTWGMEIRHRAFGVETLERINSMPAHWFNNDDVLHIRGIDYTEGAKDISRKLDLIFDPVNQEDIALPTLSGGADLEFAGLASVYSSNYWTLNGEDPRWSDFITVYTEWDKSVMAIETERTEFVDSIPKVMEQFTSLAPAIKAWPALWGLLPEDVKNKHKEIVERKKPEPRQIEGVDIAKMTAHVAVSRLTGGSNE